MHHAKIFEDGGAVVSDNSISGVTLKAHLTPAEVDALRVAFAAEKARTPITQPVPWDVNTPLIVVGAVDGLYPGSAVRVCMHRRSLRHGREYMVADASGGRAWVPESALVQCVDFAPESPEPWIPGTVWDAAVVKVGDRFRLRSAPGFSSGFGWAVGDVVEVIEAGSRMLEVRNITATVSSPGWGTHNCSAFRLGERVA